MTATTHPSQALTTLTQTLATKLNMGDGSDLIDTLKSTAFKAVTVSDSQMTALLIVATQYGLNPWTKEIYAFPDSKNGIVPVVGVDGWSRIINSHPQFDGMEFEQDDESCTCIIYRKDRGHPVRVTEWLSECKRANQSPWTSHPRRMLRHKAMIQCARLAFGYGGIYDQDEAERIVEVTANVIPAGAAQAAKPALPAAPAYYDGAQFDANFAKWSQVISSGRKRPGEIIEFVEAKGSRLTDEQKARLLSVRAAPAPEAPAAPPAPTTSTPITSAPPAPPAPPLTAAEIRQRIDSAETAQGLDDIDEAIGALEDPREREDLAQRFAALPPF